MTTLKPQLIRADTLDLQDQDAPSAKDHTRQPTHPAPYGIGPAAPHQNQALRNAEHEAQREQRFSPAVSPRHSDERQRGKYPEEPDFYDDHEDSDHNEQSAPHEHLVGELEHDSGIEDGEVGDQGDDDSEDDLMDKISSSPSIDDGKYALPVIWPPRRDSVDSAATHSSFSTPIRGKQCSSPFPSTPEHFPLSFIQETEDYPESHQGRYPGFKNNESADSKIGFEDTAESFARQVTSLDRCQHGPPDFDNCHADLDVQDFGRYLLPADDPLLENSFDDAGEDVLFYEGLDDDPDWEDEADTPPLKIGSSSHDDTGSFPFTRNPRFVDSGWGGECLREIEDIDFEFVYALHTFVATVEGQANATKGDTMVLLDDSNSYWWLVRIVKDGSIGYLPAEHIETPTERLARLNKHRNIDLAATMLGDNPEKSKNPLKKAMRRRNAKTVQFAAPQYFEPSDFDYSDEEDEGQEKQAEQVDSGLQGPSEDVQHGNGTEVAAVAPLKINTQQAGPVTNGIHRIRSDESMNSDKASSPEKQVSSEANTTNEVQEDMNIRPRNRAVRNTDSFYKDDSVETKKISLTPRLLRGDLDGGTGLEQSEARPKTSQEAFDKIVAGDNEKPKDEKKKKEKKGMLSGLFKRKDKKARPGESDVDDAEKISEESTRVSPQSRESQESISGRLVTSPQRQTSKLQKPPPTRTAAKTSPVQDGFQAKEVLSTSPADPRSPPSEVQAEPSTVRSVVPEQQNGQVGQTDQRATQKNAPARSTSPTTSPGEKKSFFSPITTALRSSPSNASLEGEPAVKVVYAKKAKHRFEIDAADSEDEGTSTTAAKPHRSISPLQSGHRSEEPREQESPVKASHIEEPKQAPPPPPQFHPILSDHPASEPQSTSPPSPSGSSSPSLVDVDNANDADQSTNDTTTSPRVDAYTPSTTRSTPTWSDASLRNYMDNDQGIRDLLIIVHDKSNVVPAGSDHPIMGNLFVTEKSRLVEMQTTLDSMLTSWLSRKNATLLSR